MDLSLSKNSFEERLPTLSKKIFFLALKFGFDEEQSKDLTQDILFKAFLKLESFKGNSKLDSWVYSIAINCCINHRRKKRILFVEYDDAIEGECYCNSPEDEFFRKELTEILLYQVQRLPEKLKAVLILRSFELLTDDEISSILDIPRGTIWSRMYKARKLLKCSLARVSHEL